MLWKIYQLIKISEKSLWQEKFSLNLQVGMSGALVDTLLPTTDLVLDRAEKKDKVRAFVK